LRFLLDVHIGMAIARALEAQGYQVFRAALAHATWTDEELLALAVREDLVIVTQDSDFSDLVTRRVHRRRQQSSTSAARPRRRRPWPIESWKRSHPAGWMAIWPSFAQRAAATAHYPK
jgi:uncharacterized protein with PIN domain